MRYWIRAQGFPERRQVERSSTLDPDHMSASRRQTSFFVEAGMSRSIDSQVGVLQECPRHGTFEALLMGLSARHAAGISGADELAFRWFGGVFPTLPCSTVACGDAASSHNWPVRKEADGNLASSAIRRWS